MKKSIVFLIIGMFAVLSAQAQFAKPLKKKSDFKKVFSIGITGSYAANDMIYSAVTKSALLPVYAPTYGLVAEWNTMQSFSVGVDVSYIMRGDNESFATEFLTSYSTTTFARVKYNISLNGVELRVPMSCYFGDGEWLKPYVYIAPRLSIWTGGQVRWERIYDDLSFQPMVFESELMCAMIQPFDLSAETGLGLCSQLKIGRRRFFIKLDLGYGISVLSNFSQDEVNGEVAFEGWGDIEHEDLGRRRLQNVEARLSFLMPLQRPVDDACDFNHKPYRSK